MKKKVKDTTPVRSENGYYLPVFVDQVLEYAKDHSDAEAMRQFKVAHSTFYGWKRRRGMEKDNA